MDIAFFLLKYLYLTSHCTFLFAQEAKDMIFIIMLKKILLPTLTLFVSIQLAYGSLDSTNPPSKDYFSILGVDRNADEKAMVTINEAYARKRAC